MMRWAVNGSLKFRRLIIAISAALIVFGLIQLGSVQRDLLPEFSPPTVEVQTEALGLSAEEVEQLITVPLEQDLLVGVAFLQDIESVSLPGLSSVVLTFEPGTDVLDARQVVAERLVQAVAAAGLPQVADPPQMLQPLSSTSRVAMVSMSSSELSPIETSVLARWVVVPRLLGVEGVANVSIWGFKDRQLQVLVDPEQLREEDVELSQIISTTGNALQVSPLSFLEASSPGTGGFIDTTNQRLHVFHEQAISTPEELSEVVLEGPDGGAVFNDGDALTLGEVAQIVEDHQPLIGEAQCGAGPCVLLVIEKFPDVSTPEVAANIDDAFAALALGLPGIEIDTSIYRPATYVETSFDTLRTSLIIGGLLLLALLAVFLRSWRVVLATALSIGASLIAVGLVFYWTGTTVNTMLMAGIVLSLVVIVTDAVMSSWTAIHDAAIEHSEGNGAPLMRRIVDYLISMRTSMQYGLAIAAAVTVPFFFLQGEAGQFLPRILGAYLLGLLVAIVVGLTVAPALAVTLLERGEETPEVSPVGKWARARHTASVRKTAERPMRALGIAAVLVVAALVTAPLLSYNMRPSLKERDVLVSIAAPPGTSLPRMDEITAELASDLRGLEGIESIGAHVGRAIQSDQVVNVNESEIWLRISESADYEDAFAAIENAVAGRDDVTTNVTTYSDQRVDAVLGRDADHLVVRVYGEDPELIRTSAENLVATLDQIDGLDEPTVEPEATEPTIEIEVDLDRAQAVGLKPGDIRRTAATLLSGIVVGNLFEEQKVFDVVVWGVPEIRQTAEDVGNLQIETPDGELVSLSEVADVRVVPNPTVIRHESVQTYVDVTGDVVGRNASDVANDIETAIGATTFPLEIHAALLGEFEEQRAANTRVLNIAVATLVGIFLLFQAAFSSWRLAALALLTLPVAVSGAAIAVLVTGGEMTLGTWAAMAAIIGLAAQGTILLIRRYRRLEWSGRAFGPELVADGSASSSLPLLAAYAGMAVLFLPAALRTAAAGHEIVGPMAIAIIGGLITTAFVTLVLIPTLYARWGYEAEPDRSTEDLFELDIREAETVRS